MEDHKLIELFFSRSETAISRLAEVYSGLCKSVIGRILPDSRDVEECLSDTYLRVWNSIPPQRPENLRAYLARIARNTALDRADHNQAQMRSSALTVAYEELAEYLPSHDGALESSAFSMFINGFLRSLAKDARIVFVRRYWYGESIRQIAQAMGWGQERVKSVLFRTRGKLRQAMLEEGIGL